VLGCVRSGAEAAAGQQGGVGDAARGAILAATGVVWEGCDALVGLCEAGVVGLAVRRAEEWRGVLLDAVVEMREWGEEADEDGDEEEDGGEGSGEEDEGGFEVFGAANRLGKGDGELRALLEASVRKLKTVAVLYQALVKRRLKTFPPPFASAPSPKDGDADADAAAAAVAQRVQTLDELMALLKSIPESVDELASAFYDLDGDEAKVLLKKCCDDAVRAATIVQQNWDGKDDEFTAWSGKWKDAMGTS
jgi:Grap2 and cyclin-D-interacting